MIIISIHAPRTGSDPSGSREPAKRKHFNPRSPHGERPICARRKARKSSNFNPRSPHGERHALVIHLGNALRISIHAPRTGSDLGHRERPKTATNFNPRSPHGERRNSDGVLFVQVTFQSTLPARGATILETVASSHHGRFQSTLPARGATQQFLGKYITDEISIHAPRTGSDDDYAADVRKMVLNFNPRSPHGERQGVIYLPRQTLNFNPRSPHGERPGEDWRWEKYINISIHAPRTGSDMVFHKLSKLGTISIHAPRTGSDLTVLFCQRCKMISIHAPRTGSDRCHSIHPEKSTYFNPRSPHGERRSPPDGFKSSSGISIHAPRTGSDP